jgi:hypothetical protein
MWGQVRALCRLHKVLGLLLQRPRWLVGSFLWGGCLSGWLGKRQVRGQVRAYMLASCLSPGGLGLLFNPQGGWARVWQGWSLHGCRGGRLGGWASDMPAPTSWMPVVNQSPLGPMLYGVKILQGDVLPHGMHWLTKPRDTWCHYKGNYKIWP